MFETPPKLLIRADAGPSIGTGHIMRTLALGQAWKRLGGSVSFVCGTLPGGLLRRFADEQFEIIQSPNDRCDSTDASHFCRIAASQNPAWIVLDGYRFDDFYQEQIHKTQARLLVIDDWGHATHRHADFVLNQNVYANPGLYSHVDESRVFAGSQFVLMRSEFNSARPYPISEPRLRKIPKEARRILVTFGGADPDNWTLKTLQVLSDLSRKRMVVDCVTGPLFPHTTTLEDFKRSTALNLRLHRNVDRMDSIMSRVDMAITAGGSTCYELAHCGVPSIVMSIAENQRPISLAFDEQNAMLSIDTSEPDNQVGNIEQRLQAAVRVLLDAPDQRQSMSAKGQKLVDGQGANRVAKNLLQSCFPFRDATLDDAQTMWQWRNDPEVRSVALRPVYESPDDYLVELQHQIENPESKTWIAEDAWGRPVGQVSFDMIDDGTCALIDVIVDQSHRGRGVGSILINCACRRFFETEDAEQVIARIKPGNSASEKAFRAASFQSIEPLVVNGKIAFQFVRTRTTVTSLHSGVARKTA